MTISKFKISNRVLSILLCLALLLSLVPLSPLTAAAATTNKNIMLGTSHITGGQASNVYFGKYQQSDLGKTEPTNGTEGVDWMKTDEQTRWDYGPYYSIDPIIWRVLSNTDGKLFLLSNQNIDLLNYHDYTEITWERSRMRSWLNGYDASFHDGYIQTDYTDDNFLDAAFSAGEQTAIEDTKVINATYDGTSGNPNPEYATPGGSDTTDKIFLLSIAEANNSAYFPDARSQIATDTAYAAGGGKKGYNSTTQGVNVADTWWLRSPGENAKSAARITSAGGIDERGSDVVSGENLVRPAFNIDTSKVLFTSAAKNGKPVGFNAVGNYNGVGWKLTLWDSSRNFAVSDTTAKTVKTGDTVSLGYTGATTGANEYISAMLVDENGEVVYYGQLAQPTAAEGKADFTVPSDIAAGTYTLKVFNEQINGDYKTDFSSNFVDITLNVFANVSYNANGGTGEMSTFRVPKDSQYGLPLNSFTAPAGYKFKCWSVGGKEYAINEEITVSAHTTVTAVWEALPAEAPTVTAGNGLTLTYNNYTNQQVSVTVTPKTGYTYSYQWYDSSNQPISNATNNTYTLPTDLTAGTHYYYCRVTAQRTDNNLTDFTDSAPIAVTVQKDTPTVTSPAAKTNLVYNEAEQELIDAGSATNGTMQYALDTSDTVAPTDGWSTDIPKAKNAGTYYVWCKVVGNANYSDVAPTCIIVKVNKANATLKTPTPSITYGEKLGDATLPSGWTWADENTVPTMVNTGYTAYYTPADTANYNWSGVSGWDEEKNRVERTVPVAVGQKTIGIDWSNTEFTYDGTEKIPTATATYTVNDESITLTVGVTGNKSPIDAGSYTATVTGITGEHKDNYKLPEYGLTCDFKIVNAGQDAPTGFTVTDETAPDRKDGKIGGLTAAMEYSTAADGTYTPVTDTDMSFAAGTYYIRYAAKTNYNASEPTAVTVNVLGKITVTFVADGVIIDTAFVDYGTDVDMSEIEQIPEKKGYTAAWDKDGKNITEATTITAVYTVNKFTGTESTEKVKDITSENVKPEDKTDLENAKEDLEDALKGDYTDEVKEEIQKEIDRINEALDVIDRVEKVEEMIEKLPDTITKDDIDDVEAAKKAYDELSDYEKTLIDPALKEKLEAAIKAAEALSKPSGSTSSGSTSSGSTSPDTGDNTNLWLWGSLLLVSGGAVIALTVYDRKKRAAQK